MQIRVTRKRTCIFGSIRFTYIIYTEERQREKMQKKEKVLVTAFFFLVIAFCFQYFLNVENLKSIRRI